MVVMSRRGCVRCRGEVALSPPLPQSCTYYALGILRCVAKGLCAGDDLRDAIDDLGFLLWGVESSKREVFLKAIEL